VVILNSQACFYISAGRAEPRNSFSIYPAFGFGVIG